MADIPTAAWLHLTVQRAVYSGGANVKELQAELERRSEASIDRLAAVGIPGLQPVFYFDGSFRT